MLHRATVRCLTGRLRTRILAAPPCTLRSFASSTSDFPDWSRKPPAPDSTENPDYLPNIAVPRPIRPATEATSTKRARLVYASRKRGILETDLLLSTFAGEQLSELSREELEEYDNLLEENDWDIYYWVTGTEGKIVPERVQQMKVFPKIVEHAKNRGRKILRMPDLKN
ncbi:hypothetical protein SpCBS45565_g01579 [Spizellomyces sp. 'palustris']|nr:hypothetical protein SpCBS45565_g01579 [Spizellomyces sp. 'palustris']